MVEPYVQGQNPDCEYQPPPIDYLALYNGDPDPYIGSSNFNSPVGSGGSETSFETDPYSYVAPLEV